MKVKQIIAVFILVLVSTFGVQAQEILSTVKIITPQLQRTDRKVFDVLETSIRDWVNSYRWTDDTYTQEERIKCNITLTIKSEDGVNGFSGELGIQSMRPVYGSNYDSPLLSHLDKDFGFNYDIYQPIEFNKDVIDNNLTAVIGFYMYVVLALDYDSFSPQGGDAYYLTAQNILNSVPPGISGRFKGWLQADGNRNRFWLIESMNSPRTRPFRTAMYNYHRKGLDVMATNPEAGKAAVMSAIEDFDKVNLSYINSMLMAVLANTKRDEIIEMWKQGSRGNKERVVDVMSRIDPAYAQRYRDVGL